MFADGLVAQHILTVLHLMKDIMGCYRIQRPMESKSSYPMFCFMIALIEFEKFVQQKLDSAS